MIRGAGLTGLAALLTVFTVAAAGGCSKGESDAAQMAEVMPEDMEMAMPASQAALVSDFAHEELIVLDEVFAVPPAFGTQIGSVYRDYLQLKDAFVSSDLELISDRRARMLTSIEAVDSGLLDGEGLEAWKSHRTVLLASLKQMEESDPIARKREHFSHVSEAVYCSARSFDLESEPIYTVYCPMANNSTGAYWLSDSEEIRNPYFGEMMLTCGEVREVIR